MCVCVCVFKRGYRWEYARITRGRRGPEWPTSDGGTGSSCGSSVKLDEWTCEWSSLVEWNGSEDKRREEVTAMATSGKIGFTLLVVAVVVVMAARGGEHTGEVCERSERRDEMRRGAADARLGMPLGVFIRQPRYPLHKDLNELIFFFFFFFYSFSNNFEQMAYVAKRVKSLQP